MKPRPENHWAPAWLGFLFAAVFVGVLFYLVWSR